MTRTIASGLKASIAAQSGVEITHFIKIEFSTGTSYLTTAPHDIVWNSQTWEGVGGVLGFSPIEESADERASGTRIILSGVDQSIISPILGAGSRGREVEIYLVHIDSSGAIVSDPLLIFRGFSNEGWSISEKRDERGAGTVDLECRAVSRLAAMARTAGIQTNMISHQRFHDGDTFWQNTPKLVGKPIIWNGTTRHVGHSPPGGPEGPEGLGWH